MDASLLAELDALVQGRGGTRSEAIRDWVRAEVEKVQTRKAVRAAGVLTLVYDHRTRELGDKLTEMQHALGEQVRSTLHIHLDRDRCLEVIVLRGMADELQKTADRIGGTKGVFHSGLDLFPEETRQKARSGVPKSAKQRTKK